MDERSGWIWPRQESGVDQYAEFYDVFDWENCTVKLRISADSNYAVYVNGQLTASGQYADFPYYKVFDELDLTSQCRQGENHLAVVVWHYGQGNMGYYPGKAALRYELWQNDSLCTCSSPATLSRISRCYHNGLAKTITGQLGFSFKYDLSQEDEWMEGKLNGFAESVTVVQKLPMFLRPVRRPVVCQPAPFHCTQRDDDRHWLVDLGREEVGLLKIRAVSDCEQDVLITYGEHIADGQVRRMIDSRDFSVELRLRKGVNEYVNPFRRLGLRYLELFASQPVELETLTVLPVMYPLEANCSLPMMNEVQKRIYDVCVRTLVLCMHEHYEDSPWREQALYAMDSRNQMLCGYDAFGEYSFARANLLLISMDEREDGLLSICTPSSDNLTIPSFSLHYFTAVQEYTQRSGDLTLAQQIWPRLERLMDTFTRRMEDGCIPIFTEKCHWNFYEWAEGMSGALHRQENRRFDAALNFLLSMALQAMQQIAQSIGRKTNYGELAQQVNTAAAKCFFNEEKGVFVNSTEDDRGSVLVNSLAILCGAAGEHAAAIAQKLSMPQSGLTPASLSMVCFQYDALLKVDEELYRNFVLDDIERKYLKMLDAGATAVWETEEGQSAFDRAGSLCHGWSAMPVHYYHRLLKQEKKGD